MFINHPHSHGFNRKLSTIGGSMDKEKIIQALGALDTEKRKFVQSYDLIITLRDFNVKTQSVDGFVTMPHSRGKKVKVCGIVGQELADQAKKELDYAIRETDLKAYKGKPKEAKKLANDHDFFIAQATLMPQVAAAFGRTFGPRGKMPNPKAGCVVPPNANLTALRERLQKTVQVKTRNALMIQCIVGNEKMKTEEVAEHFCSCDTSDKIIAK
jgi:large subunit ribosomal protein L1